MKNLTDINSLSGPDVIANDQTASRKANANKYSGAISGPDTIQQTNFAQVGATSASTAGTGFGIGGHGGPITADVSIINLSTSLNAQCNSISPSLYNKFQINFNITGLEAYINTNAPGWQYDPDQIDISVTFTGPGGAIKFVNAYYAIDYNRDLSWYNDPTGDPNPLFNHGMPSSPTNPVSSPGTGYQTTLYMGAANSPQAPDPTYLTEIPPSTIPSPTTNPTPWHARFAPPQTGEWTFVFNIKINDWLGATIPGGSFTVEPSSNPGYIGAQGRNFVFNDSTDIFFPIGAHAETNGGIPSWNRLLYLYCTRVIEQIALNGGNYARIFCTYDRFGLEIYQTLLGLPPVDDPSKTPAGLEYYLPIGDTVVYTAGNYDYGQPRAFDLDDVIAYAECQGVYLQLVLEERLDFNPGASPADWPQNAYYQILTDATPDAPWFSAAVAAAQAYYLTTAGGGYVYSYEEAVQDVKLNFAPSLFWSNETAIALYQKKLRYIMARWAMSLS